MTSDESMIEPDTIPDAVRSYNVDIPDERPYYRRNTNCINFLVNIFSYSNMKGGILM